MPDWDERYSKGEFATKEPHKLLIEWARKLKAGRALDIACGTGRHTIFLAENGWRVTGVDNSKVGIEITRERAKESGVEVEVIVADIENHEFEIKPNSYDLICDFYYLQRDLFPTIQSGIKSGGAFIAAIHIVGAKDDEEHTNKTFLMEEGELREVFKDWDIVHYYETSLVDDDKGEHHHRTAEIVAFKKSSSLRV